MQVDEKRACPACRAENAAGAEFCWQCFARLVDVPPPPAGSVARPEGLRHPVIGGSAVLGRNGGTGAPTTLGPRPIPGALEEPSASSSRTSLVIRIGLGVVGAVLGYLLVGALLGGGVEIPDSLGGLPRQTNDTARDFEEEMRSEGERWDLDVEAATYGRSSFPESMLILVEGRALDSTDQLYDALIQGMGQAGATIDTADTVSGTHEGAAYRCVPVRGAGVDGSACIWHADDHVGIVLDLANGSGGAETLVAEAHTAVTS
jgi:hypothetical protein